MTKVGIIGDCGAHNYRYALKHIYTKQSYPNIDISNITIESIVGATIYGLDNPNSITSAGIIFLKAIKNGKFKHLIIQTGVSDLLNVFPRKVYNGELKILDKNKFYNLLINKYYKFIKEIHKIVPKCRIYIVCLLPPAVNKPKTLLNGQAIPVGARIPANIHKYLRNILPEIQKFNAILNEHVPKWNNCEFIYFNDLILSESGKVKKKFIFSNKDFHLKYEEMSLIYLSILDIIMKLA